MDTCSAFEHLNKVFSLSSLSPWLDNNPVKCFILRSEIPSLVLKSCATDFPAGSGLGQIDSQGPFQLASVANFTSSLVSLLSASRETRFVLRNGSLSIQVNSANVP